MAGRRSRENAASTVPITWGTPQLFSLHVAALLGALFLFLPGCSGSGDPFPASLEIQVRFSKGDLIQPKVHTSISRLFQGEPGLMHNLDMTQSPDPGEILFINEKLSSDHYRVESRWIEYLWTEWGETGDPESAAQRILPHAKQDMALVSGEYRIAMDLIHDTGIILEVEGLPQSLEEYVQVEVREEEESEKSYTCRLGLMPGLSPSVKKGFFLPLPEGATPWIRLRGMVPDWQPEKRAAASDPPERVGFKGPDRDFSSLFLELLHQSGEGVAGDLWAQHKDWQRPFLDTRVAIQLLNTGRGGREAALAHGEYVIYLEWYGRDGFGREKLLELPIQARTTRRMMLNPAVVNYDPDKLGAGEWFAKIRQEETGEVVAEKTFTLPAERDPFSMIFKKGTYQAELFGPGGKRLLSSPFVAAPPEKVWVPLQ